MFFARRSSLITVASLCQRRSRRQSRHQLNNRGRSRQPRRRSQRKRSTSRPKGQFVAIDGQRRAFSLRRQSVVQLCGWTNVDGKGVLYDRLGSLIERDEYEKVAAIYIFQMNVTRALEVLHDGHKRGAFLLLPRCRGRDAFIDDGDMS